MHRFFVHLQHRVSVASVGKGRHVLAVDRNRPGVVLDSLPVVLLLGVSAADLKQGLEIIWVQLEAPQRALLCFVAPVQFPQAMTDVLLDQGVKAVDGLGFFVLTQGLTPLLKIQESVSFSQHFVALLDSLPVYHERDVDPKLSHSRQPLS